MAAPVHLAELMKGAATWNDAWRWDNPDIRPDLTGANLVEADLAGGEPQGRFEAKLKRIAAAKAVQDGQKQE
jgi:hypothetical protein